ncbi:sporulation inhibitor of replication protein SirA [Salibacterium aidingense]|uniref:sporulation inhibitor of replication protein SirA n=1 Tax=Salibacterium aidingense TaxID=384933 RepID=UPI003BE0D4B8
MTRYKLIIITKEVALHYFQAEDKLYRLFLDYHKAYEWARPLLEKQIHYITEPLLYPYFIDSLEKDLSKIGFDKLPSEHAAYVSCLSDSSIYLEDRHIIFDHAGSAKEEWQVFDCLKKISPYFFAVNINKEAYGWLKPLKVYSVLS